MPLDNSHIFASRPSDATGTRERFDMGKYERSIIGRPVPEHMRPLVSAVWAEKRSNYYALFSARSEAGEASFREMQSRNRN